MMFPENINITNFMQHCDLFSLDSHNAPRPKIAPSVIIFPVGYITLLPSIAVHICIIFHVVYLIVMKWHLFDVIVD